MSRLSAPPPNNILSTPIIYPNHILRPFSMSQFLALLPESPGPCFESQGDGNRARVRLPPTMDSTLHAAIQPRPVSHFLPLLPSSQEPHAQKTTHRVEHLQETLLVPQVLDSIDGIDPPPFVASSDDHISLSMMDKPKTTIKALSKMPIAPELSQRPRLYHSHARNSNDEVDPTRSSITSGSTILGNKSKSQHLHSRRQNSMPESPFPRAEDTQEELVLHRPSAAIRIVEDMDRHSSGSEFAGGQIEAHEQCNEDNEAQLGDATFEGMFESEQELAIPSRIQLRKASKGLRRASLALLETYVPAQSHDPSVESLSCTMRKSSTVTAATTLTSIFPAGHGVCSNGRILGKRDSTLQIVQSRDSVYEIIWENIVPAANERETISLLDALSDSHILHQTLGTGSDDRKTRLAAWAWNPEENSKFATRATAGFAVLSNTTTQEVQAQSETRVNETPASDARSVCTWGNDQMSSPESRGLSIQQRRELSGGRKLSNFPSEQMHFKFHRDSVQLAHRRIFLEELAAGSRSA